MDEFGEVLVAVQRDTLMLLPLTKVVDCFVNLCKDEMAGGDDGDTRFVQLLFAEAGHSCLGAGPRFEQELRDRKEKGTEPQLPAELVDCLQVQSDYSSLLVSTVDSAGLLSNFQRRCLHAAQCGGGDCVVDYGVPWSRRDGVGRSSAAHVAAAIRRQGSPQWSPEASPVDRATVPGQGPCWVVRLRCQWQQDRQPRAAGRGRAGRGT
eukprot:TRINITY_DN12197_c0_g1_i2.p2 TRINITY_DN12197_c0_g1~~TRINITY_DN12197_c0_g1_i2.p2  ORF type:complete len:207 (+),score=76.08 TRINITY_DN12197_c0_g1_i2:333-953(+)